MAKVSGIPTNEGDAISVELDQSDEEKDESGAVCYTLEQYGPDDVLASSVLDVNGNLMVIRGYDNAVGMARFILEDDELDHLPALGLLAHDHDPSTDDDPDDDRQSWSAGWVQKRDGEITVHADGATEDDAELWDWLLGIIEGQQDKAAERTILVHLNVTVEGEDPRNADEIAETLAAALHVGMEGAEHLDNLKPVIALAEEL